MPFFKSITESGGGDESKIDSCFAGNFPDNMKKVQEIVGKIKDSAELLASFL